MPLEKNIFTKTHVGGITFFLTLFIASFVWVDWQIVLDIGPPYIISRHESFMNTWSTCGVFGNSHPLLDMIFGPHMWT